jgi:hypothetical protein
MAYNATERPAFASVRTTLSGAAPPKMPGEPKRVQPSKDTDLKGKNN